MKRVEGWVRTLVLAYAGVSIAVACASKSTEASGETHFVKCKVDGDCASLGAAYTCQAGTCEKPDGSAQPTCPAGCVPAFAYELVSPDGGGYGCVDLSHKARLGCYCQASENGLSRCHVRVSDQSTWIGDVTSLSDPAAFRDCGNLFSTSFHSCDFANCTTPPQSLCSREDTCRALACGSAEYDSNGCGRTTCAIDADCSSSERCVFMNCVMAPVCTYGTDGTCGCATDLVCRPGHFCNATSDYGPGGAWSALEFDQGSGPCPPNMDCTSSYRLTPDGKLDMSKFGTKSSATVPDATLQSIVAIVDGPDLRRFMRDGFTCDPPPTDVGWSIKLEIPSGALVQDVTGCVITGPNGNLAKQLFGYLTAQ